MGNIVNVKLKGKRCKSWKVYYKKICEGAIEKVVERPDGTTITGHFISDLAAVRVRPPMWHAVIKLATIENSRGSIDHKFYTEYCYKKRAFTVFRSISAYAQDYFVDSKFEGSTMCGNYSPRNVDHVLLLKELVKYIKGKVSKIDLENCKY